MEYLTPLQTQVVQRRRQRQKPNKANLKNTSTRLERTIATICNPNDAERLHMVAIVIQGDTQG